MRCGVGRISVGERGRRYGFDVAWSRRFAAELSYQVSAGGARSVSMTTFFDAKFRRIGESGLDFCARLLSFSAPPFNAWAFSFRWR